MGRQSEDLVGEGRVHRRVGQRVTVSIRVIDTQHGHPQCTVVKTLTQWREYGE